MARYRVRIKRDTVQYIDLFVEADNKTHARSLGKVEADDNFPTREYDEVGGGGVWNTVLDVIEDEGEE